MSLANDVSVDLTDEMSALSGTLSSSMTGTVMMQMSGLTKRIGWHTFRHTFGTLLNANGENPKVIQELLRHANLKVTMGTYVQAVSDEKRNAQSKVVGMIMPGVRKREAV